MRIRPLREEEIPAWVRLVNAADRVDQLGRGLTEAGARARFRFPGRGLDQVLVAWRGRRPVGYAELQRASPERGLGMVLVHPLFRERGIGRKLLRRLALLATHHGLRYLDIPVIPSVQAAVVLLTRVGFRRVRRWWQMAWLGLRPPAPPEPPSEVRLRTYRPGQDDAAWIALMEVAFVGHWGARPLTEPEVRALVRQPDFEPGGLWFAEHEGRLIGQALARLAPTTRPGLGWIEDVAVDPAYRGRGVGRALVLAAMGYLWAHGCRLIGISVDEENLPALRLYRSLGFVEAGQLHWYRLRLQ